ncbi:hypothetical protein [Synechocystis salina]|uniref:Uncharacterized protein n=1 Tax=Synechocystis salina LEGE 00031 TaxID=1828736 RepID=A0ABR9VNW8_9SYNC|nr:hypothetical protein [Synechocystis salina]MBE9240887.1 hypothetical protein [Synechocystis salina LEGE 00041]MBE9252603.1 hypothetical protein [Synechocystis salina LEGE 00031]
MAASNANPQEQNPAILVCFSGGQEIFRKNVVDGPFADEYKFAHEIKVADSEGEHWVNFGGGMCLIDQGESFNRRQLELTDNLSCYSGAKKVVTFDVYGEETTIDEYVEGRTFLAKASGSGLASESIHRYLLFGSGTCIGEEVGED